MSAAPEALRLAVIETYERQAAVWDAQRPRGLQERGWIDRALAGAAPGAPVLDLGCGAAEPIAAYLIGQGFAVTGLDAAAAMLAIARDRFPAADWVQGDMRALDLPTRFAAIIGWDSFFHLGQADQRALIPRLVRHLAPGGRLLLTVGPQAGEVLGRVGEEPIYHASLSPEDYAALCRQAGCRAVTFVAEDPACGFRTLLLAQRAA